MDYTRHYEITYDGDIVSGNEFYESKHWAIRNSYKNKFKKLFKTLLLFHKVEKMSTFRIDIECNTRHDVDNLWTMTKFMADTIKEGYAKEDNKKYFKGMSINYNPDIKKKSIVFHIHCND